MKRLPQILLIWFGCVFAWMVLGTSLVTRTGESSSSLLRDVHLLWGPPLNQGHPSASFGVPETIQRTVMRDNGAGGQVAVREEEIVDRRVDVPLKGSALAVQLDLTHRRKGLMWFPTYTVDFGGRYTFANPSAEACNVTMRFPLEGKSTIYDGFKVTTPEGEPVESTIGNDSAHWTVRFEPGARRTFVVHYLSRGTSAWSYKLTDGTGQVDDFALDLTTNFPKVDFPPGSVAPSSHRARPGGWAGSWRFERLVASAPIGIVLPERLNPGPLASKITFFAPVGLLFFFFVVAILTTAAARSIHPMNYFFFGCAFFAFHLLFAYLVDHVAILPAFLIASATSILLVVTYARLFVGWRFALRQIGTAQLIYLVLFSYTFFWEGFTGLAITVGAILTLFVMMQVTGRMDWTQATALPSRPAAQPNT